MWKIVKFVKYQQQLLMIVLILSFYTCARVGRPTGGEKDILPPISINASPDFESLNFEGNKIKINFNEYIKFDDLNRQLVISPPLNSAPDITPLGFPSKQITIKIKDTLKPNTTYTFNFGNAITDNSEGNPLKQFKYLFSTGNHIDSLAVSGTTKDAFLSESPANVSILLYKVDSTFTDSTIFKRKPNYVSSTLDSIGFSVTNIKNGSYYLVALADKNKNLLFDPKTDKIGFVENAIVVEKDSIYQLELFLEQPQFSIKNVSELSQNHIIIGYEGILSAFIEKLIDKDDYTVDFISYKDEDKDSLHVWHKTIATDSLDIFIKQKDTLVRHSQFLRSKEFDSIQLTKNVSNIVHLRDSLYILSNTPIVDIDKDKIRLIDKDSTEIPFQIISNTLPTKFLIDFEKQEASTYFLSILPSAISDFLGQANDSLAFKFNTKKYADYGTLNFKVTSENSNIIFELLTTKGKLVAREFIQTTKELKFNNLQPGNYQIRAIFDTNKNNKWDTGNYLEKKQPERVLYYPKTIEVRANWTISEVFNLK